MATKNTTAPRLEVKGIRKTFGQNAVLKGINLSVDAGEVVALIGGNGAGKSTLMKIIMGIYSCDEGDILIDGQTVKLGKPAASLAHGIYLVPQEPMLFPNMTVLENILMGFNENESELKKRLADCMKELNFDLNLQRKANTLSIAEQQLVELLRGMMRNAQILILDEPTSSLTFNEVQSLFKTVEDLKKKGIAIIYITHRLTEVFEIATHVAIMRDGVITLEGPVKNFTKEMLIQGLLPNDAQGGQQTEKAYVPVDYAHLKPVMQVKDFSGYGFSNITFDLYPGEILGIAGIAGSGQRELLEAIAGLQKVQTGEILYNNPKNGKTENLRDKTPLQIRELGVRLSFVPEDRLGMGLVGNMDIVDNMMLRSYRKGRGAFLHRKQPKDLAASIIKQLEVVTPSASTPVRRLSGGNVQKVLVGREIAAAPTVLMAAYPVRGLDINSSYMIYNLLNEQKQKGVAVIFVGEDLDVLIELCDRILVIGSGKVTGIVDGRTAKKEEIGLLMTKTASAEKEEE